VPITWKILADERMVIARADGPVTLQDIEDYLDAVVVGEATSYAKLFDATALQPVATDEEVMLLGARMRAYMATWPGGPVAFVVTTRPAREFIDRFLNLSGGARPANIFTTIAEARRWLAEQKS
jgi:hypothetical protein